MKKLILVSLVAVSLIGCTTTGNRALQNESEVTVQNKIKEGVTTKSDVKGMFGSPDSVNFTDGGKEIWKYSFANSKVSGKAFIPFYGLFHNTVTGSKKELVVMFDGDKVSKYSMSESKIDSRTGLSTG
ncbi:hypothetical protein [Pantoea agglomerans]|uniref:hypothetical protein n=1 Tax=Enterobacter agglomerans TaxID=549 RepID=UPI003DA0817A